MNTYALIVGMLLAFAISQYAPQDRAMSADPDGFSPRVSPTELAFADKHVPIEIFPFPEELYEVKVKQVVDGDTIEGDVIMPFDLTLRHQRIRVLGVDAWEITGDDKLKGEKAKAHTEAALKGGTVWLAPGEKRDRDNFGRILASIYIERGEGKWLNLAEDLTANGHDKE